MKRVLLIYLCFLVAASMAFSQPPGSIGVFADNTATICDVYDQAPGLLQLHVVHVYTPGATAAQFKLDCTSWGPTGWTYLGEAWPYTTTIGNTQTGAAVAYGACLSGPIYLVAVQYYVQGLTPPCSFCQIVADPTATPPGIYVADCSDPPNVVTATGGDVVINPVEGCFCNIPAQETSWGQLKAFYK